MSPTPKHPYTEATLLEAIKAVKEKQLSLNKASQVFGIPYATLGDKIRGRRPVKPQPRTLLRPFEEERLVSWLKETARQGFGRSKTDIKDTVKTILDSRGAVTSSPDNRPSKQWVADFFNRHPDLSARTPMALGKERALVTPSALASWFQEMKMYLDNISPALLQSPERLYNADETGFSLCPKSKKVIAEKGSKHVYNLSSNTKNSVTVVACCSATGHFIPPLIVFPYSRRPTFNLLAGFEEASFNITPNGWITVHVFYTWLRDCFVPAVANKTKPVVLFVDGHASHTSAIEIVDLCREHGIILYCLKSHASHLIQPLDQALFGAMKVAWAEQCKKVLHQTGESVTVRTFASALKPVWDATTRPELAFKGFSHSGIYPYNPERVLSSEKLCPSRAYHSTTAPPAAAAMAAVTVPTASALAPPAASSPAPPTASSPAPPTASSPAPPAASSPAPPTASAPAPPAASAQLPPPAASKMKDLLDFAAQAGPQKLNCLWEQLASGGTQNVEAQKLKMLLAGVGYNRPTVVIPTAISDSSNITSSSSRNTLGLNTSSCATLDTILSLPQFPKNKNKQSNASKSMPMAISGLEFRQHLLNKEREREELAAAKELRKVEREENRKRKLHEQEERKKKVEENKKRRQQQKEEREAEKRRKANERQLKRILQRHSHSQPEEENSDEMLCDDSDDSGSELDGVEMQDVCKGCKNASHGLWVMCAICDGWWHTRCSMDESVINKSETELENIDFYCKSCVQD